ncbi:MAG TPA: type IV pilus twitching motility protein PilT [Armatimonadota bacterium]|nr:type IV pilus twitching motility protein PilT [Armatimonadota bacterium]
MPLNYTLDELLRQMPGLDASDLHLRVGEPPMFRVHGTLERLDYPALEPGDPEEIMYGIMDDRRKAIYQEMWEMDMAYELEGVARFRVNCFRQKGHLGAVLRMIPIDIQTIEDLGLPEILGNVAMLPRGLVLVTGPTGSGKSTTLAAMVNKINQEIRKHIVTIEDPVEFVHTDVKSVINQREIGQDTHSFPNALKRVVRQAPDVILVGEMRDLETISLAITAAETGHLVFGTLHTTDAMQTVDRAIDVFPPAQQAQVRTQLAVTLQAVVCQALLPVKEGEGRIPAFEIMIGTHGIRAAIREGKTHMLYNMIQAGADEGMIVLDQYLVGLVQQDLVEFEQALSKSSYPKEFYIRCGVEPPEGAAVT